MRKIILLAIIYLFVDFSKFAEAEQFSNIYSFRGGNDGADPRSSLVMGRNGNFYGTTLKGGGKGHDGGGVIFELFQPQRGGEWRERVIYKFSHLLAPSSLAVGRNGDLYGVTQYGGNDRCQGNSGCGTVFSLKKRNGSDAWDYTVIYSFKNQIDGYQPISSIIISDSEDIYGTTYGGGIYFGSPSIEYGGNLGTVFKLSPPNSGLGEWHKTTLYNFKGGVDGSLPMANLTFGKGGDLYGTTSGGGKNCAQQPGVFYGCGTVFSLRPGSSFESQWNKETIYKFTGLSDGKNPHSAVMVDGNGGLYGTAMFGGSIDSRENNLGGYGAIFQLIPPLSGVGEWQEKTIYKFSGNDDGGRPMANLVTGRDGSLYGTSFLGTVFKLPPPREGSDMGGGVVLHKFHDNSEGDALWGGVVIDKDGFLFGLTGSGGEHKKGSVYRIGG